MLTGLISLSATGCKDHLKFQVFIVCSTFLKIQRKYCRFMRIFTSYKYHEHVCCHCTDLLAVPHRTVAFFFLITYIMWYIKIEAICGSAEIGIVPLPAVVILKAFSLFPVMSALLDSIIESDKKDEKERLNAHHELCMTTF